MSSNDIKQNVAELFRINADTFDIQVYDECFKNSFVLDNEYLQRLHERLPRIIVSTLHGDILLNSSSSGCYILNQCDKEAELQDSEFNGLFQWNMINHANTTPEEINLINHGEDDTENEFLEALLITASEEEDADVCQLEEFDYPKNSSEPKSRIDPTNSLALNDEIKRNICQPDTSCWTDENELHISESIDLQGQTVLRNVVDAVTVQAVESLRTDWDEQNSDGPSLYLSNQTAQHIPSARLSPSLQFVRDVHPYQKTQNDTNNSDDCSDKDLASYVMRIQGIKTDAVKGQSILPQLKLPSSYFSLYQQQEQSLYLMVAAVREAKVNDKRILHACNDMQFLPTGTIKQTDAVNPIQVDLYSLPIESDGTFELSLRLINNPSRSTRKHIKDRLFYELDEEIAANLHNTPYDPRFFRLVCTLVKDNTIAWDTLCLSDYIRPKQRVNPWSFY